MSIIPVQGKSLKNQVWSLIKNLAFHNNFFLLLSACMSVSMPALISMVSVLFFCMDVMESSYKNHVMFNISFASSFALSFLLKKVSKCAANGYDY